MQPVLQKNIAILCNVLAGSGRAIEMAESISGELKKMNIEHILFTTTWPDQFENITDIFIAGGDGTLNYFINKYPGIRLPLVIFNGGTGNDFHWCLYGNLGWKEQLQTMLAKESQPVDIGKCNEHFFINGIGIGFEGEVAKALAGKKKRPGKASFLITTLKKIFTYRSNNYFIKSGELELRGKKLLIDVSNGRRAGGGFHIAPLAKANDGLFDIVIADALISIQRLRFLPVIEKGNHLQLPFIHYFRTSEIYIESDQLIQFHLDGEYGEASKLEIELLPQALNFRY
ncbi:MAG: diacylglycerol/lipid kinase family protein [Chitinophagaceae bacterium]